MYSSCLVPSFVIKFAILNYISHLFSCHFSVDECTTCDVTANRKKSHLCYQLDEHKNFLLIIEWRTAARDFFFYSLSPHTQHISMPLFIFIASKWKICCIHQSFSGPLVRQQYINYAMLRPVSSDSIFAYSQPTICISFSFSHRILFSFFFSYSHKYKLCVADEIATAGVWLMCRIQFVCVCVCAQHRKRHSNKCLY